MLPEIPKSTRNLQAQANQTHDTFKRTGMSGASGLMLRSQAQLNLVSPLKQRPSLNQSAIKERPPKTLDLLSPQVTSGKSFNLDSYITPKPLLDKRASVGPSFVKSKACRAVEQEAKKKSYIPGVGRYNNKEQLNWADQNNFSVNTKFNKAKNMTTIEQIFEKAKSPEKTTPGPDVYNSPSGWKYPKQKGLGTINLHAEKITYIGDAEASSVTVPGPANYSTVDSYRYKQKKPIAHTISKSPRGEKKNPELAESPSPITYEIGKAKDYVISSTKRFSISKSRKTTLITEMAEKKQKIPGVGSYTNLQSALDKVTSPMSKKRF